MGKENSPEIPAGSVALALAFLNLGPEEPAQPFGRLIPGGANRQIAKKLESLADRFSLVLTQQAVSDGLADPTQLSDGTPVFQMHRHCDVPVFTFAALGCALDRLPPGDWPLVVIAHPRHLRRVRMGLSALAGQRRVFYISSGPVIYQDDHWSRPLYWSAKNAAGWLVDGLLSASRRWPMAAALLRAPLARINAHIHCPEAARLGRLRLVNGRWQA
jgi:hypothetical protein